MMQTCNMDESNPAVIDINKLSIIFEQCKKDGDYILLTPKGELHIGSIDQLAVVLFAAKLKGEGQ